MNEKVSSRAPMGLSRWALRLGTLAALLAASCSSGVETTETRDEQTLARLTSERASDSSTPPPPPDDLVKTIGAAEVLTVAGKVADLYRPAAASYHEATIEILPRWDNPSWSVFADIDSVRQWKVHYSAGILTEHCTRDTVRWVTCHEMGHFFGGFPFHSARAPVSSIDDMGTFLSSEGTADYFSAKDCLRRVWDEDPNNAAFRDLVPAEGRTRCNAAFASQEDRDICYRTVVVAKKAMLWIGRVVDITTPSTVVVDKTLGGHFDPQCRFDTIVAGALCGAPTDLSVIPGLVPAPWNGLYGAHSVPSEQASKPYACHNPSAGARPACWFKPDYPDTFDCTGIPELGKCEGDSVVRCGVHSGIERYSCANGCIIVHDPDIGDYADCADP